MRKSYVHSSEVLHVSVDPPIVEKSQHMHTQDNYVTFFLAAPFWMECDKRNAMSTATMRGINKMGV